MVIVTVLLVIIISNIGQAKADGIDNVFRQQEADQKALRYQQEEYWQRQVYMQQANELQREQVKQYEDYQDRQVTQPFQNEEWYRDDGE